MPRFLPRTQRLRRRANTTDESGGRRVLRGAPLVLGCCDIIARAVALTLPANGNDHIESVRASRASAVDGRPLLESPIELTKLPSFSSRWLPSSDFAVKCFLLEDIFHWLNNRVADAERGASFRCPGRSAPMFSPNTLQRLKSPPAPRRTFRIRRPCRSLLRRPRDREASSSRRVSHRW